MARDLGVLTNAGILLGSPTGLLLLCMIIMSLSMVIFVCGDSNNRDGCYRGRAAGVGGGADCGGGGGGCGGGCGGGA
ncbi:hypothetical protein RGQ29_029165 [Quercus rubra]|uniref:Uncharacterized protein n=1 Tax=Quercus rubra TaxID=3512 RepID=A0AAN7EU49_QUERU|nr:hypothetical protein RGQ29_029165 [Quercus rubra]